MLGSLQEAEASRPSGLALRSAPLRGRILGPAPPSLADAGRVLCISGAGRAIGEDEGEDEARASELRASAARLRSSVDPKQIELASNEARLANDLIDRRTFSWTELFNVFEKTLPDEVRITAVRPRVERGQFGLTIIDAASVPPAARASHGLRDVPPHAGCV